MPKKLTHEEFVYKVFELVGDEFTVVTNYVRSHDKLIFRHNNKFCDNHEFEMKPNAFLNGQRCPKCALETKRQKKAFSDNEFQARLRDIFNNEFTTEDKYYNQNTVMTFTHTKCGRKFNTTPKSIFLHGNCHLCKKEENILKRTKSHETFIEEIFNLYGNEFEIITKYECSDIHVAVKHNNPSCGYHEYKVLPYNILNGYGCPKCAGHYKTHDDFTRDVYNLTKNEYSVLGTYINNKTSIMMRHNSEDCGHFEYKVSPNSFLKGNRCPRCKSSKGEKEISKYLDLYNISNISQYWFQDCRNVFPLPFDFAIFNNTDKLIYLIEYDGEQHYKPIRFGGISEERAIENLKVAKLHDQIKNDYCGENNIPLLRIPYWEFDNIEEILKVNLSNIA